MKYIMVFVGIMGFVALDLHAGKTVQQADDEEEVVGGRMPMMEHELRAYSRAVTEEYERYFGKSKLTQKIEAFAARYKARKAGASASTSTSASPEGMVSAVPQSTNGAAKKGTASAARPAVPAH